MVEEVLNVRTHIQYDGVHEIHRVNFEDHFLMESASKHYSFSEQFNVQAKDPVELDLSLAI